jgi:hypothetical protein
MLQMIGTSESFALAASPQPGAGVTTINEAEQESRSIT